MTAEDLRNLLPDRIKAPASELPEWAYCQCWRADCDLLRWTRVLERLSDTLSTIFAPLGASFDCAEALAMFAVRGRRASSEETEEAVLAEYMRTWVILGRSHVRPLWDREHVESVLEHSR